MSHEDATHGPAPMGRVDTEPMHRAVDALAAALHDYVGTAVGVRAEFGAAEADEDPRVLALESKVGHLNAALFDTLHGSLGMHPDLTSSVWEPEDECRGRRDHRVRACRRAASRSTWASSSRARGGDASLDGVIDLLDAAGESVATHLTEGGYDIAEWAASRGEAPGFGFYEEDDE